MYLETEVRALREVKRETRQKATLSAADFQKDIVDESRNVHSMDDAANRLFTIEERLERMIAASIMEKEEILELLNSISNSRLRTLALKRYVQMKSWVAIEREMHLSHEQTRRDWHTLLDQIAEAREKKK